MLKKILYLLSKSEKKKLTLLFFLIILMAFFDLLGISSIAPFISLLSNPEVFETNIIILKSFNISSKYFGTENKDQFIILFGSLVGALFLISIFIRAFTVYALTHFSMMREHSIGKKLIEGYLHQNYQWFLNRNSAELGKTVLSEVQQVIDLAFIPMLHLISQTIVAVALISLLIFYNPILSLTIGLILSISYLLIFYFLKNFLTRIGNERLLANENRFHAVSEAFGANKEVKLGNLENNYVSIFSKNAKIFSKNKSLALIISTLPRYLIEAMCFGLMILAILIFISAGNEFANMIPTIAIYSFAAYRLMPTLQQIYSSSTKLRFSKPALNALYEDMKKLKNYKNSSEQDLHKTFKFNQIISLSDVYYNYPNAKKAALSDINISIKPYTKVGIVGSTGSGKTTIVDIILGLLPIEKGYLSVDGIKIDSKNKRSWQKILGYVPQQIYLSDTSISKNIAFGVIEDDIDQLKIERVSKIANLHNFVMNKLPNGYDTIVGERGIRLSGGEKQRIGIARALYNDPKVIIFDEATSALDNITEKIVLDAINKLKDRVTVIMIAHRLETVKECEQIYLISNGKVTSKGSYEELLRFSKEFQRMTGLK